MNIQTPKPAPRYHQWLRLIVEKILPRGVRKRLLLVAETLALKVSPSLAFPSPVLYRGAMVLLPLIATLRMVWRSRPDPEAPFAGSKMTTEQLYKRVWRLNILWMGAFNGLIMQNH